MVKKLIVLISILIIAYYILAWIFIMIAPKKYEIQNTQNIEAIIVLGAQVNKDKTPSSNLKSRLDTTFLYKDLNVPIIVSGGQGADEPMTEANFMKEYLVNLGMDSKNIYEEDQATSTYENLKFSKEILEEKLNYNSGTILIITNKFHVFRTGFLANFLNIPVYIVGVDTKIDTRNIIREPLAIIKSFIFDRN